jgi:hypothetical protein
MLMMMANVRIATPVINPICRLIEIFSKIFGASTVSSLALIGRVDHCAFLK